MESRKPGKFVQKFLSGILVSNSYILDAVHATGDCVAIIELIC